MRVKHHFRYQTGEFPAYPVKAGAALFGEFVVFPHPPLCDADAAAEEALSFQGMQEWVEAPGTQGVPETAKGAVERLPVHRLLSCPVQNKEPDHPL